MSRPTTNNHFNYDELDSHAAHAPVETSVMVSELDAVVTVDPDEGVYDYNAHLSMLSFQEGISPPTNTPTARRSFTLDDPVISAELSRLCSAGFTETRELSHGELAPILRSAACARAFSRGEAYHCGSASLRLAPCPGSDHLGNSHCALYMAHPFGEHFGDAGRGWQLQACSRPDLHGPPPDELSSALAAHEGLSRQPTRDRRAGRTRTRRR